MLAYQAGVTLTVICVMVVRWKKLSGMPYDVVCASAMAATSGWSDCNKCSGMFCRFVEQEGLIAAAVYPYKDKELHWPRWKFLLKHHFFPAVQIETVWINTRPSSLSVVCQVSV